jgi:hypothetical protein
MYTRPYGGGVRFAALLLLAIGLAACGSDEEIGGGNNISSNNGNVNATTPDADLDATDGGEPLDADSGATDVPGSADADTSDEPDNGPAADVDGGSDDADDAEVDTAPPDVPSDDCNNPPDLGVLSPGSPLSISGDFDDLTDQFDVSCADDGPDAVWRFEVDVDSVVTISEDWQGQYSAKFEVRTEGCTTQASASMCYERQSSMFLAAGTEAFLVAKQDIGIPGPFEIELSAVEETCPPETRQCASSTEVEVCRGAGQSDVYTCPGGQACSAGACVGDHCDAPISITGPGKVTVSGNLRAFSSDFDFSDYDETCNVQATAVDTPGSDVVFALEGLAAGSTVKIDALTNDSNQNAIFIKPTAECGTDVGCVGAWLNDEQPEWEVPPGGGANAVYLVVIDRISAGGQSFEYSVEVE